MTTEKTQDIPDSQQPLSFREVVIHAGLLVLLLALVFPGVFLQGHVIAPGDILFVCPPWKDYAPVGWERPANRLMSDVLTAFYPYYATSLHALDNNEWPLWNPFELGGIPLMANYQSAVFYPPRLLHSMFGLHEGTTLYILTKLWLCGMMAFLCGRAIGLRSPAARFLSVGWMLASYNLIWCNWSLPDVSPWLPVLFLGVERILSRRYRTGFFAIAFGGTLLLLSGHPETAFTMGLGLGFYFLCRLIYERRRWAEASHAIGVCASGWALAITVSAAQILPFLEYLVHSSTFLERVEQPKLTSLPAGTVAALWIPRFFGTSAENNYWGAINSNLYSMIYPGIAVWLGIAVAIPALRTRSNDRARLAALLTAAVLCLLFAFEMYPLSLINKLPVFGSLIIAYHSAFPVFAFPLIAAYALDRWFEQRRPWKSLGFLLGAIVIVFLVLAFLLYYFGPLIRSARLQEYMRFQLVVAAGFTLAGGLLIASACRPTPWRGAAPLLTILLAIDLLFANRGLNPTMPAKDVFPKTALTDFLRAQPVPCRVGTGEGNIASGLITVYGIEEWLGYDGLYPERIIRFQRALGQSFWNAMEPAASIQYYLHDPRYEPCFPLDAGGVHERVGEPLDGLEIYRNRRAYPRAYLVKTEEVVPDRQTLFNRLADPSFKPNECALLERPPRGDSLPLPSENLSGQARIVSYTPTKVVIETKTNAPCLLVLADAFYPGWKATLDQRPVEILPAYYIFRAVVVPAGQHHVEFSYFPTSLQVGLVLSLLGMAVGVFIAVQTRRRISVTQ